MALLLYILLFIFLYYVVKAALKIYTVYRKLHNATKQFRDFSAQQNTAGTYGSSANGNAARGRASTRQTATTSTGEVIEDRRTEDEINRKIFTREEGEYIDFEEE